MPAIASPKPPPPTRGKRRSHWLDAREVWAFATHVGKRFIDESCFAAAGALSYTTLLSLVPLLAIALGILSAFPIFSEMQDKILALALRNLAPDIGDTAQHYVREFALSAGRTGAIGVAALAVTAIMLLATIEDRLDAVWRVTVARSWLSRVRIYWTVLTLGPILLAVGISLTAYFNTFSVPTRFGGAYVAQIEEWFSWANVLIPFILEVVLFSLLFFMMPNCSVILRDAVIGSVVSGLLLEVLKFGFSVYIGRFASYQAVYGALAAIPITLFWMYLTWTVVLFGAVVAASLPRWRGAEEFVDRTPSIRTLGVSLALLAELRRGLDSGDATPTRALSHRLELSSAVVDDHLKILAKAHFVAPNATGEWLLVRNPMKATLFDLFRALKLPLAADWQQLMARSNPWQVFVAKPMADVASAERETLCIPLSKLLDQVDEGVLDVGKSA